MQGNRRWQWGQSEACREGKGLGSRQDWMPNLGMTTPPQPPQPAPLSPPDATSHWGLWTAARVTDENLIQHTRRRMSICKGPTIHEIPQILDVKPCIHTYNQSHTQISESLQGGRTHTQHIPRMQTHTGALVYAHRYDRWSPSVSSHKRKCLMDALHWFTAALTQ